MSVHPETKSPYGFPGARLGLLGSNIYETADAAIRKQDVQPTTGRPQTKRRNSLSASFQYRRLKKTAVTDVPLIRKTKRPSSRIVRVVDWEWSKSYNRARSMVRWDRGGNNGHRWLSALHKACKAYRVANQTTSDPPEHTQDTQSEALINPKNICTKYTVGSRSRMSKDRPRCSLQ